MQAGSKARHGDYATDRLVTAGVRERSSLATEEDAEAYVPNDLVLPLVKGVALLASVCLSRVVDALCRLLRLPQGPDSY